MYSCFNIEGGGGAVMQDGPQLFANSAVAGGVNRHRAVYRATRFQDDAHELAKEILRTRTRTVTILKRFQLLHTTVHRYSPSGQPVLL